MGENSKIEWTDNTFNPWMGCTKVSPACAHCYAERDMDKRYGKVARGPVGTRVLTSEANWQKPLRWDREAAESGVRPRVFCASLADVFEDWLGPIIGSHGNRILTYDDDVVETDGPEVDPWRHATMSDLRVRLFRLIAATPNLDWLLLTKRPENIRRMLPSVVHDVMRGGVKEGEITKTFWPNVWLGTSVESQEWADKRIPELRKCRDLSPVLFLSCEPMVGPVELWPSAFNDCPGFEDTVMDPTTGIYECCAKCDYSGTSDEIAIDWVIAGGESGPDARPANPDWFRSLRYQCAAAGVPFHFKQWGEFDERQILVGKKNAGRLLDGVTHDGLPVVSVV